MSRLILVGVFAGITALPSLLLAQGVPASDPQALAYASQAIAALSGGTAITDVTLTGNATYTAGDDETGPATLMAVGTGESRMDLSLPTGNSD